MKGLWLILSVVSVIQCSTLGPGQIRTYYLAAVEVDWDYAPGGSHLVPNDTSKADEKLEGGEDRIGKIYKKVVYKQFTDSNYDREIAKHRHLGYLGPVLRAEVGDTLQIHFKNMATGRNYSIHPHGVLYEKDSEGALYGDGTNGTLKADDGVAPGATHTYIWNITKAFAPTREDEKCIPWAYHSHVSSVQDINTGLVGCLITCQNGILDIDGTRKDVDKEFIIYTENVDENDGWKIEENLRKCENYSACAALMDTRDSDFINSNVMPSINGYMFGNLPQLSAKEDQKIAWHFMGMNQGMRGVTINGQTFEYRKKRVDTLGLYPATFVTANMKAMSPGQWLLQSRTDNEYEGGMWAFFDVTWSGWKKWRNRGIRKFYLAAEEEEWNYGPTGLNTLDGTSLLANGSDSELYFKVGTNFLGGTYKKVRYVEYTDCNFNKRKESANSEHLGILGPMLRVAVGEKVVVVFKNKASRNYSFLPRGVKISKAQEGALYNGDPFSNEISGKYAAPGQTVTYTFSVPRSVGPTEHDSDCITSMYQSAVDPVRDVHSGLLGPLLICNRRSLNREGERRLVNKDFAVFFLTIDENLSWYVEDNIREHSTDPENVDRESSDFISSNRMHSINGFLYGNLKGLDMCMNDKISWHVASAGDFLSLHGTHFHGNTMLIDGSNRDSEIVIPGTSFTGEMTPDSKGVWEIVCRTNYHYRTGMRVQYQVKGCGEENQKSYYNRYRRATTRQYYIAAIEIDWDYAPGNMDLISGHNMSDPHTNGHIFVRNDKGFLGSKYRKVVYREFTDETFSTMKVRSADEEHLGILGPIIRAEVFDTIQITFWNNASRPYSIHPHGVFYNKSNEGVKYGEKSEDDENKIDTGTGSGSQVFPGRKHTYTWLVPERAGPIKNSKDPDCVSWMYYSAVDSVKDMSTGLVGPLVICKDGFLNKNGTRRRDVNREFALLFNIMDENDSWLLSENIDRYGSPETDPDDADFRLSNQMNMINGKIFGNLHGLEMEEGEYIAWYVLGLGSSFDIHTVHFHGQTYLHRKGIVHRGDVVEVFPGTYETVEMKTDNPGTWILHCHVNYHIIRGMEATYTIKPNKDNSPVISWPWWLGGLRPFFGE